jgi:hypothetical protein
LVELFAIIAIFSPAAAGALPTFGPPPHPVSQSAIIVTAVVVCLFIIAVSIFS